MQNLLNRLVTFSFGGEHDVENIIAIIPEHSTPENFKINYNNLIKNAEKTNITVQKELKVILEQQSKISKYLNKYENKTDIKPETLQKIKKMEKELDASLIKYVAVSQKRISIYPENMIELAGGIILEKEVKFFFQNKENSNEVF